LHLTQYSASSEYCVWHIGQRFTCVPPYKMYPQKIGILYSVPKAGAYIFPASFLHYSIESRCDENHLKRLDINK
jgi:hypothetical protein